MDDQWNMLDLAPSVGSFKHDFHTCRALVEKKISVIIHIVSSLGKRGNHNFVGASS